eukprot:TRINITY_DN3703_c0_g1_i1.p1 TRINITY_DN3703_c0_g1~~TRINITY_DN3703_c0_g1_i1.p1  ORF type:complete len:100 (+),score=18.34 TRINITY_DN3703_c0_g1_i1:116-415(+)
MSYKSREDQSKHKGIRKKRRHHRRRRDRRRSKQAQKTLADQVSDMNLKALKSRRIKLTMTPTTTTTTITPQPTPTPPSTMSMEEAGLVLVDLAAGLFSM